MVKACDFQYAALSLYNFYPDENTGALTPKRGPAYEFELNVDTNGDGRQDFTRQKYSYDLLFEHKVNDAAMWTRTMIISETDRDKSLKVLLRDYVDSISGYGYALASVGGLVTVSVQVKRFATEVLETETFALEGQREALRATLSVADLDQVELSPSDRARRVTLLFIKTGWNWRHWTSGVTAGNQAYSARAVDFPIILLVGYANHPDDYAAQLPDFARLVAQIELFEQEASPLEGIDLPPEGKPGTGQRIVLP
ncbi:MAG: hypothetical protein H6729_01260 [Deltaproteobacteria bacterium]|nr:hypothetical protein [Deltaproteobacteria bacterium]